RRGRSRRGRGRCPRGARAGSPRRRSATAPGGRTSSRVAGRRGRDRPRRKVPATLNWFDSDRKSTRLNSSHDQISYAVFYLKKKKKKINTNRAYNKLLYTR